MRILDRSVYVGPSLYARFPVIRLELDLGPLEAWPTGRLGPEFVDALAAALPGLAAPGCSYTEPGGSFGACGKTRAPGSATCSNMSPSSCRTWRARKSPSARPAAAARTASIP